MGVAKVSDVTHRRGRSHDVTSVCPRFEGGGNVGAEERGRGGRRRGGVREGNVLERVLPREGTIK